MTDTVNKDTTTGAAVTETKTTPLARDENGQFIPNARGKTKDAMDIMIDKGLSDTYAAQQAGCRLDNLRRSMRHPSNIAYFNQRISEIRANQGQAAYIRNIELAQTATSEHVKADLNKWLAGVDGISAVQKVSGTMQHNHQFGGFAYEKPDPAQSAKNITPNGVQDD